MTRVLDVKYVTITCEGFDGFFMSVPRPQTFVPNEKAPFNPAILSGLTFSSFPLKILMFLMPFDLRRLKTSDISFKS